MRDSRGSRTPRELIERQRREYFEALWDLDALARRLDGKATLAERLAIEGASLHLEVDLKWLDHADEQLNQGETS